MEEVEDMTTYDFVHLVLHAAGGRIHGRTRLQVVVYFVGALADKLPGLRYRPHYYAPYSSDVSGAVQELHGLRFLVRTPCSGDAYEEHGFEITRCDYVLIAEGEQIAKEKETVFPAEWVRIRRAVEQLSTAPVRDYIRLAIAAKADILTRRAGHPLPPDTLRAKTTEHGWKEFSDEQFTEALAFLESLRRLQALPTSAEGTSDHGPTQ
jgi:uncharacterized protein